MTKPPKKIANIERREREFLTPHEIDQLIDASKKLGRHSHMSLAKHTGPIK